MRPALTLLDGVRWNGEPVRGERSRVLLATLALQPRGGASTDRLVEEIWGDQAPANPAKALQVVVSRTRAATAAEVVESVPHGYRLGPVEVDAVTLAVLVQSATEALHGGDASVAAAQAREALDLAGGGARGTDRQSDGSNALDELRWRADEQLERARALLGSALSRTGDHAEALPLLEQSVTSASGDDQWVCLLRSEAAVRGPSAALERYERHRAELADRLGTDPGPELQRLHGELLAADRPVREGVHFDATPLLGRDGDLRALRALVDSSRVTSIVGAGGLGKTRLAHVLARSASQPVVHFVELAGVAAEEDVVGEVGSALGVRDSVSSLRTVTPQQRADLRTRVAAQLDGPPTLLVLDNCEHVITAVAELAAFLVATTRDLSVVTTSRAPLAIAAERVYTLGELAVDDAVELFVQRAEAARPSVSLDHSTVTDVVTRLDCLPLALELAAAKVRVMSVEDLSRRLEHRFTLLRGGDRSAPGRHQTLLAVIDWSWNLLAEPERRALRILAVFHDGFTLEAAEHVLGSGTLDSLQHLVDQSLLTVADTAGSVRYRMLETVREFGRMQLVDAGDDRDAALAQRRWATSYAGRLAQQLNGPQDFAAMDEIRVEEGNLADVLHQALHDGDAESVVVLFAALGGYWTLRGEHARVFALVDAIEAVFEGWQPPPELADVTRASVTTLISAELIGYPTDPVALRGLLSRIGPGDRSMPVGAVATVVLALDPGDPAAERRQIEALSEDPERRVAFQAQRYLSHLLENAGDPEGGLRAVERCAELYREEDGPFARASVDATLAQLHSQLGHPEQAIVHAERAVPVLDRLGARDDALQARQCVAVAMIEQGRLDEAEQLLDQVDRLGRGIPDFSGAAVRSDIGRAELAAARGDVPEALRRYRIAVEVNRTLRLPGMLPGPTEFSGLEPWTMFAESAALTAYARHGTGDDGADLWEHLQRSCLRLLGDRTFLDYPVLGLVLFSLGMWGLRREALAPDDAIRLLVLGERFGYNRFVPTIAWRHGVAAAEQSAPGRLAELEQTYGERRGPELLDEAAAHVARLFG